MSHSLLLAFVLFATVMMFFTPGPNNIMLLSSGQTYGFRPTIPHIYGGSAAGLALSGLHGRMMPQRAMPKRVSPPGRNALDNAGNSRATGGPIHLSA